MRPPGKGGLPEGKVNLLRHYNYLTWSENVVLLVIAPAVAMTVICVLPASVWTALGLL